MANQGKEGDGGNKPASGPQRGTETSRKPAEQSTGGLGSFQPQQRGGREPSSQSQKADRQRQEDRQAQPQQKQQQEDRKARPQQKPQRRQQQDGRGSRSAGSGNFAADRERASQAGRRGGEHSGSNR